MKPAKILYFVDGVSPTPEDFEAASKLTAQVVFRNAQAVPAEGALEECDGVAGAIPPTYAELPTAEDAIKTVSEKLAALAKLVGDSPAPKAPAKPANAPAAAPAAVGKGQAPAQAGKPAAAPAWTPNAAQ
jgi:hypothetical protein